MKIEIKRRILEKIESYSVADSLAATRRFLLDSVVALFCVFGFFSLAVGGLEAYLQERWEVIWIYVSAYLPVLVCFFYKEKISYKKQASIILLDLYILSVLILVGVGLSGAGINLLITFCVLTTTFLGIRMGLVSVVMSAGVILIIGSGMSQGWIPLNMTAMGNSGRMEAWLMAATLFFLIGSIMVICPGVLLHNLLKSMEMIQKNTQELQDSNLSLKKALEGQAKTQEALRKSEEQYRHDFEENIAGTYIVTPEGRLIACNQEYQRIFGFDDIQQAMNTRIYDIYEDPNERVEFLKRLQQEKRITGYEAQLKKVDGTPLQVVINSSGVFDEAGALTHIRGFLLDISEKRKLEARLKQSQKMETIGTLAGGIAHDFNNILFPLLGHAEMLLEDIPSDSPFRPGLDEIRKGAIRARDLVKQILTFSRQETHELKVIKIQPIIKEVVHLIRATIPTTIQIQQEIMENCGAIKADSTQIHQLIMNLCTNAYHALEESGGELTLGLREIQLNPWDLPGPDMASGAYACLTVKDTGVGMDKIMKEKIFDPFFSTKEVGKGTGMGLSVVHGIVKAMSGHIQVSSVVGKGSEFSVYFPVVTQIFEEKNIPAHEFIPRGTEHILLVDDEESIVAMEKKMLGRLGYQVSSHTSSQEALAAFRANPDHFNLVITDMAMPHLPGDRLAGELIKIRQDIPILICTGFSKTMSEQEAHSAGITGFLSKPVRMKELAQKIRDVLDKNR